MSTSLENAPPTERHHVSSTFPGSATAQGGADRVPRGPHRHTAAGKRARSGPMADRLFGWAAMGAALLTLALLIGILLSLIAGAWPAIAKYGLGFLTSSVWDPVNDEYGGLVMIYGTLATSAIALLIAVPVSFGIALFLTELSPAWLKRPLGTAIELLAAVPSIVYGGMWGLLVFGPILAAYAAAAAARSCSPACPISAHWSPVRRWASASSRPASSWRS